MDHLDAIDDLREGIGLRGYGQRDPLVEYKNEAYAMFERLIAGIDSEIVHRIFKVQVQLAPQVQNTTNTTNITNTTKQANVTDVSNKLGRNDSCPCGSGKKWKKCHYPDIP
jgi:preprotein translocase subunit SecA